MADERCLTVTRSAAPAFGEHTRVVLSELLGLDDAAIDGLERDGVIASAPRAGLISARQLDLDGLLAAGRLLEVDTASRPRLEAEFSGESPA